MDFKGDIDIKRFLRLGVVTTIQRTSYVLGVQDQGIVVYDSDLQLLVIWNGTAWVTFAVPNVTPMNRGYLASATIPVQDVNDNGAIQLTNIRADTGWSFAGNVYSFAGVPNRVRIDAMVHQQDPGFNVQRAAPNLVLQRNNGSGWTDMAEGATGYIRDTSGHEESSNTIAFTDPNPGTNPQYRLRSQQESLEGDPINSRIGHFSLEAIIMTNVLIP